MANALPDLKHLQEELRQGRASAVLTAVDQLAMNDPPADELLRLKITALEALGYDGEALETVLLLQEQRLPAVVRLLAKMPDVVVTYELESALVDLLQSEEFFHPQVYQVLVDRLAEKLQAQGPSPTPLSTLAQDPFFCLALAKLDLWWPDVELALTALRRRILLESAEASDAAAPIMALIHGMAVQCYKNEYAWYCNTDEEACLERAEQQLRLQCDNPKLLLTGLLLMYRSPTDLERAALVSREQSDDESSGLEAFVSTTLADHARESRLAGNFAGTGPSGDETSARVAGMYEENPYPRWTSGLPVLNPTGQLPEAFFQLLESPAWQSKPTRPLRSILVAGCGTGLQPLSVAAALPGTRMVAIDITCRSLAYAEMMAERYGITNVEFQRRDILELPTWGEQFDMVESVGVIHHMRDPAAGLRALLTCLKPGGLLRLGVYSRSGRDAIIRFRSQQAGAGVTPSALRAIRHEIVQAGDSGAFRDLLRFRDFYTLSGCRDLLLHEQEIQFNIPELQALLQANDLTFLRFATQPGMNAALPGPGTSPFELEHWHQAELLSPSLFAGMYILLARFDGRAEP